MNHRHLGKCAICFREIAEMIPWNSKKCADGMFYPVHQSCLDEETAPTLTVESVTTGQLAVLMPEGVSMASLAPSVGPLFSTTATEKFSNDLEISTGDTSKPAETETSTDSTVTTTKSLPDTPTPPDSSNTPSSETPLGVSSSESAPTMASPPSSSEKPSPKPGASSEVPTAVASPISTSIPSPSTTSAPKSAASKAPAKKAPAKTPPPKES
jgi:hypothetical protein